MKPSHRVFVNEFLRTGDQVKAYQKAYPNISDHAARNAANRLLQDPEIADFINKVYEDVKGEVMAEFSDRMVELFDLKVYLSKIIRGELQYGREVNSRNGIVTLHQQPGFSQVLRAIDTLCRLEGWYKKSAESVERRVEGDMRVEKESERAEEEDRGAEGLQILSPGEMDRLRKELLRIGKAHEAYLQEIKDEAGILTYLFFVLDEEYGLNHLDETELLELQAEVEARLLNRVPEQAEEVVTETELPVPEKENKNIDLLQQITTKSFAADSRPVICDFTTKPQKNDADNGA